MELRARLRTIAVAVAAVLPLGCAHMKIQVDVLDSALWASPAYVESVTVSRIVEMEHSIRDGRFVADREARKAGLRDVLRKMSRETPPRVPPVFVRDLTKSFNRSIDAAYADGQRKFEAAFNALQKASQARLVEEQAGSLSEAKGLYAQGRGLLVALSARLGEDVRNTLSLEPETAREVDQQISAGLIGDAGILDDPRAAAVVYAPDAHWKGKFNETLCWGSFGNTDCVVKMEGLGDFTLKGVRLDAAKITQATFSVTRQVVQMAAAMYGIPIPSGPLQAGSLPGQEGAAAVDAEAPVKRLRDASAATLQLRLARVAMFETIVAQRGAIVSDATREASLTTIRTVLEANAKQLDPTQSP